MGGPDQQRPSNTQKSLLIRNPASQKNLLLYGGRAQQNTFSEMLTLIRLGYHKSSRLISTFTIFARWPETEEKSLTIVLRLVRRPVNHLVERSIQKRNSDGQ